MRSATSTSPASAAAGPDPAARSKGDRWSLADQGGGRLGASGSHQVDLMRELVGAIREQRQPAGATFEDGWRNQLVLDAVQRSSAERRRIELDA